MSNVKIPAFAEAASRRQANDKGMSKFEINRQSPLAPPLVKGGWGDLTFELHLNFELCRLTLPYLTTPVFFQISRTLASGRMT
jgi:hypothetical protein